MRSHRLPFVRLSDAVRHGCPAAPNHCWTHQPTERDIAD
jgi:hypothetical protein